MRISNTLWICTSFGILHSSRLFSHHHALLLHWICVLMVFQHFISIDPAYNVRWLRSEEYPKGEQDIRTTIYFVFQSKFKVHIYKPGILKRFRTQQKMERTGWILVTSSLVALVASQGCPDEDLNLKKWSDDATWNGQVYEYIFMP